MSGMPRDGEDAADVERPEEEPDTPVRRPRQFTRGAVLIAVATVLWIPLAGYAQSDPSGQGGLLGTLLVALCLYFAVRAGRGRHIARITVTVLVGLMTLYLGPYVWVGFTDPDFLYGPEYAVLDLVAIAVAGWGLTELYRPEASAYIRAQRDQRG